MKPTVLVVEDEEKLRRVIELQLKTAGYEVEQARTAEDALKLADRADIIITDLRLPGSSGLEMLQKLRSEDSRTPVIVMTAFGSIETAVEAMKAGAVDFLPKPFSLDHLMTVVNKALEVRTLRGESGVGKDMIARAIHHHSPRDNKPFVKINCTALPENLMESELFGYEKGAFTGANISKPGKFEQADTGTVFMDEIGDVPPGIQVKLLRILQDR